MIRAAVVGATGYTGAELLRILARHPQVRVTHMTSESSPGRPLAEFHPALRARDPMILEKYDAGRLARDADVAFFALPHGASSRAVAAWAALGKKAVDLSADFRLRDIRTYEAWYKTKHAAPALLKKAVYGLPELFRAKITPEVSVVANPGCYATTSILALAPLLKRGLADPSSLVVNAASGTSGAGRKVDAMYQYVQVNENFQPYAVAGHRHQPEIEQSLADAVGKKAVITFVPHLLPMDRGILVTAYARLRVRGAASRVRKAFEEDYGREPFIRLLPEGTWPRTKDTAFTNFCDINVHVDARAGRIIVLAALDNLVKGAAGQAVQNMNRVFGLDETEGLL